MKEHSIPRNLNIKFEPPEGKEKFPEAAQKADLNFTGRIYNSRRLPVVILNNLTEEEINKIETLVGTSGQIRNELVEALFDSHSASDTD